MDKMVKISHFLLFCFELSSILPQIIPKISSLGQKSIYTSISALFSFKNDKKWEMLTIFSILPYTDGFFGSNFYILGNAPPPNLAKK